SGQNARPAWAIWFEARPISSRPSNRTDPVRRATMPMIDLSVVVLPAPLRPRSVTTSPWRTSNDTPCRMCDSPYHACRSRTASSGAAFDAAVAPGNALAMPGPHVCLDDGRIRRYRLVVTLRKDLAARQDGDVIGQRRDDRKVV